jgi:hypothetical protein
VKAGAAAGTIYFAEKLWRRNRVGAVAMMVVVNGVTAAVVAHNYKVADRCDSAAAAHRLDGGRHVQALADRGEDGPTVSPFCPYRRPRIGP